MAKIAFLTGIPASGKSCLAKTLKKEGYRILAGDAVLHWTSMRLCPFLKPMHTWAEDFWPAMINHCEVHAAMRRVLVDVFHSPSPPVIVEAYLFAIGGLRDALASAFRDAGSPVEDVATFWLDISPAECVLRVAARIAKDRPWEQPIAEAEANRRRSFLAEHLDRTAIADASAESQAGKIREFLGPPGSGH